MKRRRFLSIAAAALVPVRAMAQAQWRGRAFGAEAQITLEGPAHQTGPALAAITAEVTRIEALFSLMDAGSALCRLNRTGHAAGDADMLAVLHLCGQMHALTGGLFDPTVQPLWRALAEGCDPVAARKAVGWDRVRFGPAGITLGRGQALTLNGIAQGWAADRIRAVLQARGFTRALVDMGEIAALGGPWSVGLADAGLGTFGTRHITATALATSSPGALRLTDQMDHILGPQGQVAVWSTITVEHDSAAMADALSTALCLADRAAIHHIAARVPGLHGIVAVSPEGEVSSF